MSELLWNRLLKIGLGLAVLVGGLTAGSFYFPLPTRRGEVKKPVPLWAGRLGYVAAGLLLLYWGLTQTWVLPPRRMGLRILTYTERDILWMVVGLWLAGLGLRAAATCYRELADCTPGPRSPMRWLWPLWLAAYGALLIYGGLRHY